MVNFRDPAVVAQSEWARVKFWHVLIGIFLWEFFTTLDYEWKVIRGRIPYRWTILIYSLTRMSALMNALLCIVGMDSTIPIDCQPWFSTLLVVSYVPVASASLLIILRVIAIWDRNKAVMATTIGLWVINSAFLIYGIVQLRAEWVAHTCEPINTTSNTLTVISIAVTDNALLLIMLLGLLRLRRHGGGFGLTNLLWKQGVIWMLLAAAAEVPPAVLIILDLNDQINIMFQVSSLVTMSIAATRMHRSLVDFASKPSDIGHDNPPPRDLAFSETNQTSAMSIPIQVTLNIQQHPTLQMGFHSLRIGTDVEVQEKPDGLHLRDNVEGNV